jgi:putative redox protein
MLDHIEREIELTGDITKAQRERLLEIANKRPVHRTPTSKIKTDSKLI